MQTFLKWYYSCFSSGINKFLKQLSNILMKKHVVKNIRTRNSNFWGSCNFSKYLCISSGKQFQEILMEFMIDQGILQKFSIHIAN